MLQSDRCGDHFLPFVHPVDPAGRADHRIVKYHQLRFGAHKVGQRGVPAVHRTPQAVGQHDLLPGKSGSSAIGPIFNGISLAVRGLTLFGFCISVLQETTAKQLNRITKIRFTIITCYQ